MAQRIHAAGLLLAVPFLALIGALLVAEVVYEIRKGRH